MDKDFISEVVDSMFSPQSHEKSRKEFIDYVNKMIEDVKNDKNLNAVNKLKIILALQNGLGADAKAEAKAKEIMKDWRL